MNTSSRNPAATPARLALIRASARRLAARKAAERAEARAEELEQLAVEQADDEMGLDPIDAERRRLTRELDGGRGAANLEEHSETLDDGAIEGVEMEVLP